jgi:hypothetical protein
MRRLLLACLCLVVACSSRAPDSDRRLILVTLDGTRWQEVFRGADEAMAAEAKVGASPFLQGGPDDKRRALMPFLWNTVAAKGQIFGDRDAGNQVVVGNPHRTSYPGYHDLLCGFTSLDINGNDKVANPDVTVLEWLEGRPGFHRRVATFASWELFPFILDVERTGLPVDAGLGRDRTTMLDRLRGEVPPPWRGSVYDAFTVEAALRYLEGHDVRVLYLALGDTDEWGHLGRYDRYLEAIHRADGWIGALWDRIEASPAFRGRTSLIITTDHGRGSTAQSWRQHSPTVAGAEEAWLAVMGPHTEARGARRDHAQVVLTQVAATAAILVGEDFRATIGAAAAPVTLGN